MMKELSMHIMDIAQNSITAGAKNISIELTEDTAKNLFSFIITDDGCGMSRDFVEKVRNPFTTSRSTRKIGLGIPMLEQSCIQSGGRLELESELGKGTRLAAYMDYDNIDRPPLGDIQNSIFLLVIMYPCVNLVYKHEYNDKVYELNTAEIKEALDGVPLDEPEVREWLKENIREGLEEIKKQDALRALQKD